MEPNVFQKTLRPLDKLSASTRIIWPDILSPSLQNNILLLTNKILENENTIGFPAPLNERQGKSEMAALATSIATGEKHLLLIKHKASGDIIGHLILSQNKLPNCHHIAEISRAMVHPEYRGYSAILLGMYAVLKKCEKIDVKILQLDVRANTRIHRLWKGMGFKSIGIMEDYARVNNRSYSGCFMYQHIEELKNRFVQQN